MIQTYPSLATLSSHFESALDAVIVVDENDRVVYANSATSNITGRPLDEIIGRYAYEPMPEHARERLHALIEEHAATKPFGTIMRGTSVLMRSDGEEREIEYTASPFIVDGRRLVTIMYHDVTETRRLAREVQALTQIASRVAFGDTLELTVDKMAETVVRATGAVASGVCLVDEEGHVRVFGSYGLPKGPEAEARWREAVQRGAELPNLDSIRERRPCIHADARKKLLNNPVFEPIAPFLREATWETVASVPLLYRNRAIGALNVFYPRGKNPSSTDIAFLTAIADQAALAAENARLFAEAKEKAILEERQRLARELHDSVSQALYGIALGARTARTLLDRDPTLAAEPLDYVLSLAEAGLAEMRALIFELRPETLETEGLVVALTRQIESVRARHKLQIRAEWCEDPQLPYEITEAIYRIAQEALNNIVKHAHARQAVVRLTCGVDEIHFEVSDDGDGFASEEAFPGHLGLRTMRERATRLGGTLQVESAPAQGTRILVTIPQAASQKSALPAH